MSTTAIRPTTQRPSNRLKTPRAKRIILAVIVVVVLILMALGTKVVGNGSGAAASAGEFSAANYGKTEFPKVQKAIEKQAVDASTLAEAIAADPTAAGKKYGVPGTTGPELSVKFTGTVSGPAADGVYPVTVAGLPTALQIRVQTGPAINGTDLRDATGKIKFGQFTNQIDYQNAGAALNKQMKKSVLNKIDTTSLQGKTVEVVGAFQLINPNGWLVTPVKLSVQ
jgi:predicted lipoprotein